MEPYTEEIKELCSQVQDGEELTLNNCLPTSIHESADSRKPARLNQSQSIEDKEQQKTEETSEETSAQPANKPEAPIIANNVSNSLSRPESPIQNTNTENKEISDLTIIVKSNEPTETEIDQNKNDIDSISNPDSEISAQSTNKPQVPTQEQWSPMNPTGKKKYEREFLLELKNGPESKKIPQYLLDLKLNNNIVIKDSNNRDMEPNTEEIDELCSQVQDGEEKQKTDELYKKFRGILNKLTPKNLRTLLFQVKALPIDNAERLTGVVKLVFEKAVDEPTYLVAYAGMCQVLQNMQVPVRNSGQKSEMANFRKILINRCQEEFEKYLEAETNKVKQIEEINNCSDPENKKELQTTLEEEWRRIRMKSLANMSFLGELYKLSMLAINIMHRVIKQLLKGTDEESLECLCKLLTTIGKDLESKKQDMGSYIEQMKQLANRPREISSRVRFMVQDVEELRHNNWVPRSINESANAWKPDRLKQSQSQEDIEKQKTDKLYKKVRGILNKLTPKNLRTLLFQVKALPIDNAERLTGVVKLVFEKAVNEPTYLVAYAGMCQVLQNVQVRVTNSGQKSEMANFRKILINRCQEEFEKYLEAETNKVKQIEEINNCSDPEQKKESLTTLEEEWRRIRMKSLGNMRFIGELYKLSMLTVNIMHRCIKQLLNGTDEESLECLCKLLTTIGKDLESKKQDMGSYIEQMKQLANRRKEISSRVRFMVQDVEELRHNNWVPRRDDSNPKTIDQIQKEAERERDAIETMNLTLSNTPRKDDRLQDRRKTKNETDWQHVSSSSRRIIEMNKIKQMKKLEYLVSSSPVNISSLTRQITEQEIKEKITQLLKAENMRTLTDSFSDWTNINVGDAVKKPAFIRALTTAICEVSLREIPNTFKLHEETFNYLNILLTKYIDNNPELELQCIYAIQAFVHKLEHPSSLLYDIFNHLWKSSIISSEAFFQWENSKDPAEAQGKAVAVKSVVALFSLMKETEDSDEDSTIDGQLELRHKGKFSQWGSGAATKKEEKKTPAFNNNKFAALDTSDLDKRPTDLIRSSNTLGLDMESDRKRMLNTHRNEGRSTPPVSRSHSRDNSSAHRDAHNTMPFANVVSITSSMGSGIQGPSVGSSNSGPVSREILSTRGIITPSSTPATTTTTTTTTTPPESLKTAVLLDDYKIKRHTLIILNEYLSNANLEEVSLGVLDHFIVEQRIDFVNEILNQGMERSVSVREHIGTMLASLVTKDTLKANDVLDGFMNLFEVAEDLIIDVSLFWNFSADILAPIINSKSVSWTQFRDAIKAKNIDCSELLPHLFQIIVKVQTPSTIRQAFEEQKVEFKDFLPPHSDLDKYIKDNKLEYLVSSSPRQITEQEIKEKITQLLKAENMRTLTDSFSDWTNINVGDAVKKPAFIRALTTAICEVSHPEIVRRLPFIRYGFLNEGTFNSLNILLTKYIDNNRELELQCIYAIQAFVHKLKHPQGLLYDIFNQLWKSSIISSEAFFQWENSRDPAEAQGKDVAVESVIDLFFQIKETEERRFR